MQNIDVRFSATSNFGKVKAELAALQAQAASLGDVFAKGAYATPPAVVDVDRWKAASNAVHQASSVYRAAASSSGLLTTQQIRATSEAERYTKALQKQKLTFGEMRKHQGIMKQVYQDQLRYQRMTAQYWGTDSAGRAITDIAIPKNVPRDLDTVAQRLYFTGEMAKSASKQIVNMGKNMQWAGRQLTVGFTYPLALLGAAAGVMAFKVDDAMTSITKVYDVSAAAQADEATRVKELNDVRVRSMEVASQAAKDYGMSIENTLGIEQQLAATGQRGQKLFESTSEVARISMLGDIDPTQATDMTIALQTAFKDTIKTTEDLSNAFNYMNAVENATSLTLQDIAEATPRAASAMAALGVSAQEMTVLLVSMREAGVDAAEGANALKSATGTILSPSPAAIEFIKEIAGGRVAKAMENIRETSGGNLLEAMRQINELTKDMSSSDRQAVLVKMFGKYQFNRVSAMIDNLGAAWDGAQNQSRKAMDLMQADMDELAKKAKQEEEERAKSASGRFKSAWQTFRGELAEMGKPFLEAATKILNAFTGVAEFFNDMDDWKKKAIMLVAAIMAIVGPVVMLGGLFMNLGGQFMTGIGRMMTGIGRLGGAFGLLNKEEQAATLSAQSQNEAMMAQQKTTSTLAQEINVLTAAYQKANQAAREFAVSQGAIPPTVAPGTRVPFAPGPGAPTGTPGGFAAWSNSPLPTPAQQKAAIAAAQEQKRLAQEQAIAQAKAAAQMKLFAAAGAVGAASMITMMTTSNETAQHIAKYGLIASIAVPAMVTLVPLMKSAAVWMGVTAKNTWNAAAGTFAARGGIMGMVAGAKAFGVALNTAMGPIGWITLAGTAMFGAVMWSKKQEEEREQKRAEAAKNALDAQKALNNAATYWADTIGKAAQNYGRFVNQVVGTAGVNPTKIQEQKKMWEEEEPAEGQEKNTVEAYKAISDEVQKANYEIQLFSDLQAISGLTAKQAAVALQAFYMAAGESFEEAALKASLMLDEWGDFSGLGKSMKALRAALDYAMEGEAADMEERGKAVGNAFVRALGETTGPKQVERLFKEINTTAENGWRDAYDAIMATPAGEDALIAGFGVESFEQFKEWIRQQGEDVLTAFPKDAMLEWDFLTPGPNGLTSITEEESEALDDLITKAYELEHGMVQGAAGALNLGDGIENLEHLMATTKIQAYTSSYADLREKVVMGANALKYMRKEAKKGNVDPALVREERQRQLITFQIYAASKGIKQSANYADQLRYLLRNIKVEATGAKDETEGIKKALDGLPSSVTISVRAQQIGGIVQTAMSNVQSAMATSAMNAFNSDWDSRMSAAQNSYEAAQNAMQNRHEAASNALERRQEAAQEAFERRWEARRKAIEKAYEKRINAINREIEAERKADEERQRLFEKEKQRLTRLAEMANTNIDFNTALNEGRLDDAAKIQNNAGASQGGDQMDAELEAAQRRTEAKIAALEKKNERLEKQRDKELENLEKLEEKMRKHLERVQEARRNALEKHQQAEVQALEATEESQMESLERQRDYEEAMLEQRLELFQAYTARNQRDLERWMREVGLSYDDFGEDVKAKGKDWSVYFREELSAQIRKAGTEVANDNIWESVGRRMADKLLQGLGFKNLADFNHFIRTGQRGGDGPETNHGGGIVGAGGSGRGNIPNTYKGLHRTEQMVRAQKGEYIINKRDAAKNLPLLQRINRGEDLNDFSRSTGAPRAGMGPGRAHERNAGFGALPANEAAPYQYSHYAGPAGFEQGLIAKMFMRGAGETFQNNYQVGLQKERERARRERQRQRNNQPGTRNVDIPEGTDPRGVAAINWAAARIGQSGWYNLCLSFVRQAFGANGGVPDAKTSWYGTRNKYSTAGGVPAGVPVFWTTGTYGHVALTTDNRGGMISTDHPVHDQPGRTTISSVSNWLGASPAGWSADINGKQVYPALRTGGHLRADTLVQAHRGETMLTAPLTKKFKDGISNGGDTFHVTLDLRGAMIKEDIDIKKAVNAAIDERENKLGRRRVVK